MSVRTDHIAATCFKPLSVFIALAMICASPVDAQLSLTFEELPSQAFSDPIDGSPTAEVASSATRVDMTFPFSFDGGSQLEVSLGFQRRAFRYTGFAGGDPPIDALYESHLSLSLTRPINDRWSLLGILSPGMASDLEGKLDTQDFNIQAVLAGIRRVSPGFAWGVGVAYSTQFGKPLPLPVALLDWNDGNKWSWTTILLTSSELWYAHSDHAQFGLRLSTGGNSYQGDPDIYDVDDPELLYSTVTVGPSVRLAFGAVAIQVEGGVVPYNRFEFFDGTETQGSFGVKKTGFVRFGLTIAP